MMNSCQVSRSDVLTIVRQNYLSTLQFMFVDTQPSETKSSLILHSYVLMDHKAKFKISVQFETVISLPNMNKILLDIIGSGY